MRSSLYVRDHASQLFSTTGNITVFYILILKFLERSREDKVFGLNNNINFLLEVYILFPRESNFNLSTKSLNI